MNMNKLVSERERQRVRQRERVRERVRQRERVRERVRQREERERESSVHFLRLVCGYRDAFGSGIVVVAADDNVIYAFTVHYLKSSPSSLWVSGCAWVRWQ